MNRLKTFVATKNAGKLLEIRALLSATELDLDVYPTYVAPVEGDTSYADNAALKARTLHRQLRDAGIAAAALADDSGLEVAALGGRPGVLSARYAGTSVTWPVRRERLLEELAPVPLENRQAKFCCAMALVFANGDEIAGYGEVEGLVTAEEIGRFGFGYDPIFWYAPDGTTFAQMDEDRKNAISHRRRAADALLAALRARAPS